LARALAYDAGMNTKQKICARLLAVSLWSIAIVMIAAAASVCSSCGAENASAAAMQCTPAR
jgi:hypothetical protein